MFANSIPSIVIFLALIFENLEVGFCGRPPPSNGWAKFGKGSRNQSTLDEYEQTKNKLPRPPINRQSTGFPDDAAAVDQLTKGIAQLNVLANMATHISVKDYGKILDFVRKTVRQDLCMCGVAGLLQGNKNCLEAFANFQRVPKNMRGNNCQGAYLARCYKHGSEDIPMCSFFIKTSPGHVKPVTGIWKPLTVCAQDIENPPAVGMPGANWILD